MGEHIINPGGGEPEEGQSPKIFVDSDWKAEAQKERERLAESERAAGEQAGAGEQGMPEADFPSLVRMLATQAVMYLGGIPDPETGRAVVAPEYARLHIDLLATLEEKTRGNLTDEEQKELTGILHELRMRFVDIMGAVEEAQRKQTSQEGQPGGQGGAGA